MADMKQVLLGGELKRIYQILKAYDEGIIVNPSEDWEMDYYEEHIADKKGLKNILKKIEKLLSKKEFVEINKEGVHIKIMQLRKATEQDKKEAIKIAQNLKEWFNDEGIKNMKTDFKLNNLVVTIDKGKVSGFLCYTTNCGKMQLIWMGVKRDTQRKGIGEKLLKWLEKEAKKYKLHSIEVETLPDEDDYEPYKRTRAFYYKNGFKRIFYKKARVKGWDDQIVLEKVIK